MKFPNVTYLDVETYWDAEYTLKKLTTEEYIRDPRFLAFGWGVDRRGERMWLNPDDFREWSRNVDWSNEIVCCHNTRFDGAILSWMYGINPRLWVDTLSMARAVYPFYKSYSLEKICLALGLGQKGDEYMNTKGVRSLAHPAWTRLGTYCLQDVYLTRMLYEHLAPYFPAIEYKLVDLTVRMFTEPLLTIDTQHMQTFLDAHIKEKDELLAKAGQRKEIFSSSDKFAAYLRELGVEPPRKVGAKGRTIYAFAKTDAAFTALLEHDDDRVATAAAVRLGVKSTITETRTAKLIRLGGRGPVPVDLNYWGARGTGRHSGASGLNWQNLPSRAGKEIRQGITAPAGYKIVVGDSSNIELRVAMKLAGQDDVVAKIRTYDAIPEDDRVTDLYCDFASECYGRVVVKPNKKMNVEGDPKERFVGKTGMLGLQYGAGPPKFQFMLKTQGKVEMALEECERIVNFYRRRHNRIRQMWYYLDQQVLPAIARAEPMVPVDVNGWVLTTGDGFALPGNLGVVYKSLRVAPATMGASGWMYDSHEGPTNLYGAKAFENLCQHVARQIVMFQSLLVAQRFKVVNLVHDEIVSCVREDDAEECERYMLQCLTTAPRWAEGLPLAGEAGIGDSYGSAK